MTIWKSSYRFHRIPMNSQKVLLRRIMNWLIAELLGIFLEFIYRSQEEEFLEQSSEGTTEL